MNNTTNKLPAGNRLPLPTNLQEAKLYFAHGPMIPLHYDTSHDTGEAAERDPKTMRQLRSWYQQMQSTKSR